jgi:hypothetical protein
MAGIAGRPVDEAGADAPFLFAVGCVRSGTTMLRAMLDSHPDVAVPPESYFVAPALHRRARYAGSGPNGTTGIDADRLLADVVADPSFGDWHLPPARLESLRRDPPRTVPAAITRLYAAYAAEHGKTRAADRTPSNVLEIDLLAEQFPGARFVHLVRDGRDVVPSLLTMEFGPDRFADATLFWRTRVLRARAAGRRLGPGRYREVRYEDLVADPARSLGAVCAFAGIRYEPAMLAYHERAAELIGGLRDTAHVQGVRRPPTAGVRDWRTAMADGDVKLFDALAGDALDAFGYPRSALDVPARVRVDAAVHRVRRTVALRARTLRTRVRRRLLARRDRVPDGLPDPARERVEEGA